MTGLLGTLESILGDFQLGGDPLPGTVIVSDNTLITVTLPIPVLVESVVDVGSYALFPLSVGAFPIGINSATPITSVVRSGTDLSVLGPHRVVIPGTPFVAGDVGRYLALSSTMNDVDFVRIDSLNGANDLNVDKQLVVTDPASGNIPYTLLDKITRFQLQVSKPTGKEYYGFFARLQTEPGKWVTFLTSFQANAIRPRIVGTRTLSEGQIIIKFSEPILNEPELTNPLTYTISSPTQAKVLFVRTVSATEVILETTGLIVGENFTVDISDSATISKFTSDVVSTTDTSIRELNDPGLITRQLSDSLAITDDTIRDAGVINRQNLDQISIFDDITVFPIILGDFISVTDRVALEQSKVMSDTVSVTDLVVTGTGVVEASDSVAITEQIIVSGQQTLQLGDTLSVTDAVNIETNELSVGDSITIVDSVAKDFSFTKADTMAFGTDEVVTEIIAGEQEEALMPPFGEMLAGQVWNGLGGWISINL